MKKTPLILEYTSPAPEYADFVFARQDDKPYAGWEKWSLPLGNSRFGVSLFGRTLKDRIQITENSVANPIFSGGHWKTGSAGTRTFGDLIFDFGHEHVQNYRRYLCLDNAVSGVSYEYDGVKYEREYFVSYPDNVLAIRLTASEKGKLAFTLTPLISFCGPDCHTVGDGAGRDGEIFSDGEYLVMDGVSFFYDIKYEGRVRVINHGGNMENIDGVIYVHEADSAEVYFSCGTNYKLESRVFTEENPKLKLAPYPAPTEKIKETLSKAVAKGYDALKRDHIADHTSLFGRLCVDLGGEYNGTPTDELLEAYKNGTESRYLEELIFQYGRYLLIASSRKGGYPANLQGTWNAYDSSPWGCDYHHNINVQMNYWPAQISNLAECFDIYTDYAKAYMPLARANADKYILTNYPDKYEGEGKNGWTMGTTATLYYISEPSMHSGPGTGGFTALLFWEHYEYTKNTAYLKEVAYPYLLEMSRFLIKVLVEKDGKYLTGISASPEQTDKNGKYYITTGCAFDQQMIYENFDRTLRAAKLLGISSREEPLLAEISKVMPYLDPVLIGADGQVKEFREEENYGDIGEYEHRHISHLVSLYPGTLINKRTPKWLNGAKITLDLRSDKSTGWAAAHRLCLWSRTGEGNRTHKLLRSIIKNNILPNLWDTHPPFQIDGNFGATAGICEMLLQSCAGYIDVLPTLPDVWASGSFEGICARGNFVVSCEWKNKKPYSIRVISNAGGVCRLRFDGADRAIVDDREYSLDADIISFPTQKGETVNIMIG